MKRFLVFVLLLTVNSPLRPAVVAQDKISRVGASVAVNADGSVTVTLKSGKTLKLVPQAALPVTCVDGQLFFKIGVGLHQCLDNEWREFSTGGGGLGNVAGPESATPDNVPLLDATGKILSDSGKAFSTDGTLASSSDANVPTEKAVKTYADTKQAALGFTPVPNTRTVNGHALNADVTVSKGDLGLGSVDDTGDAGKPVSTAQQTALNLKENSASKDGTGGYVGLTGYKINFKNAANTFASFFQNANTAARTYTFQDRDGTIADDTNLALKANLSGGNTLSGTQAIAGAVVQTSNSATAVASGPNGATNPMLLLDNSAASAATGIKITGNAAGAGSTIDAISSGNDEYLVLRGKGSGQPCLGAKYPSGACWFGSSSTLILPGGSAITTVSNGQIIIINPKLINATNDGIINSADVPTLSGFGASPSVVNSSGNYAFTINVGTGGSASTGTITLPATKTGWVVNCQDVTNPDSFVTSQTGGATTTATLKNYSRTTGLEIAWTASDILRCTARGY